MLESERAKIIRRIRQLFAIANDPGAPESKTALKLAHELIERHSIDQVDIEYRHVSSFAKKMVMNGALPWARALATILGPFCKCEVFVLQSNHKALFVWGDNHNVEVFSTLYANLKAQIDNYIEALKKTQRYENIQDRGKRKSYISRYRNGMVAGIGDKLEAISKLENIAGSATALAVYDKAIHERFEKEFGKSTPVSNAMSFSDEGHTAGKHLDIFKGVKET